MTGPITMDEVTVPGPDGFQPFFFKKYRKIVGKDICKMVQDAFHCRFFDPHLLDILVVLIQKVSPHFTERDAAYKPLQCGLQVLTIVLVILR
ncbi:hypothetical protein Lal_00042665 [Lupinus albus]|nr:hypothetical protein Lal_00042665 [Lupinus albus]